MIGGLLALLTAVTFAVSNATVRRGVLTGSAFQAVAISVILGVPLFAAGMVAAGGAPALAQFPAASIVLLAVAGIIHFGAGRYCNFRATKAMGTNLVGPVQQFSLVVTLALAVTWLGEVMTPLRLAGIALVVIGPALTFGGKDDQRKPPLPAPDAADAASFKPNYAEGYFYALLSSIGFGTSPILIRLALNAKGVAVGLAGGLISYLAAGVVIVLLALLTRQGHRSIRIDRRTLKWFALSGVLICVSQMFRYMALAIAPVSVVSPIQRLSLIFRIYLSRLINPQHEVFGGDVIWATVVSLIGAVALSISTGKGVDALHLPLWLDSPLTWH